MKNKSTQDFNRNDQLYQTLANENDQLQSKVPAMSKSHFSGFFNSGRLKTKFEQILVGKLGYEWKNIYRACVQLDADGLGILPFDDFVKTCERYGTSLVPAELKHLKKAYSLGNDPEEIAALGLLNEQEAEKMISYKKLSINLGLHKESFNFLSKVQSMNRITNMSKLRKLYQQNEFMRCKINNGEYDNLLNQKGLLNKTSKSTHGLATLKQTNEGATTLQDAQASYGFSKYQTCQKEKGLNFANTLSLTQSARRKGNKLMKFQGKGVTVSQTLNANDTKHKQKEPSSTFKFMGKRKSLNEKIQNHDEYLQKLTDQLVGQCAKKTAHAYVYDQKERSTAASGASARKEFGTRASSQLNSTTGFDANISPHTNYTSDDKITKILSNRQKLIAFREMVIMHIKKNDLSTKIISEDIEKHSKDLILPLSSFKQCL